MRRRGSKTHSLKLFAHVLESCYINTYVHSCRLAVAARSACELRSDLIKLHALWRAFDQSSQTRSPHSHLNKLTTVRPLRGSGNRHTNWSFSELQRLHFRGGAFTRETFSSLIIYAECG